MREIRELNVGAYVVSATALRAALQTLAPSARDGEYRLTDCVHQIQDGNQSIVGVMIESNIEAGNQPLPEDLSQLKYGCSITDPCVDWPTTEQMLRKARQVLREILPRRAKSVR